MRVFKPLLLLFTLLVLKSSFCKAQNIDSLLVLQQQADPQEKVFVHFDKNYYNPGETIWFKAYLFTGLVRSITTKNFYAELRDERGVLLDKKTAPVIFSGAAGNFDLPDSFPKSTVYFRAYTTTMLNGDTDFLYVKPIKIINQPKKSTPAKQPVQAPETRFLPEGGDWVAGLNCRVAFKTTDQNEAPVSSQGVIKDAAGNQVGTFASLHDGMGAFTMIPEAGKAYTAFWKDEKGKEYKTILPPVKNSGIAMQVVNAEGAKRYSVERLPDAAENLRSLTIIGVMNEQLIYQALLNLSVRTSVSALMPTADLPSGILQITVFDANMKPLAERISFVNNSNYEFDADAWISDLNTGKRELNRGEVKIGDTIPANVSISITDADMDVPENKYHDNIVTRMLLTGNLRGKINDPYYYFYSTADSTAYYLDLVMLTHGWRRYNWDRVLAGKVPPAPYKESNYLAVKGKLINAQGSAFEQGLALNGFMRTQDSASMFVNIPVERDGSINFDGIVFYDSAKLYLQFNDQKREFEPAMLNVNNGMLQGNPVAGLTQGLRQTAYGPDSLVAARNMKNNTAELKIAAKQYKDAHELQNVTVTAKAKTEIEKLDEKYASGMFSGDAKGFDVKNDPLAASSFSIFQYLQGKVAGLQINASANPPQLTWRGASPVIYLNEMQADPSMIQSLSMADIAYVKVFSPSSAGVIRSSGGGVISIYTKKGGDATASGESKLGKVNLQGYSPIKQFYSPDYATAGDAFYENLRTTLFWDPFIILNKAQKRFKFQFYNNDITSSFRIVMEGINEEGKLVHIEKVITKN